MTRAWTWSLNRGLVWARHPGASLPKRMTASWSGPTWGQPNTSLRRELPRPMAGSPRFVCFPPAASQQTHRRQIRCCQDIARQKTSLASATPNDTPAARRRCRPPACRRCIPMPDRGQQEPLRGLPPCVGRPLASTKKPLDRGSPIQVQAVFSSPARPLPTCGDDGRSAARRRPKNALSYADDFVILSRGSAAEALALSAHESGSACDVRKLTQRVRIGWWSGGPAARQEGSPSCLPRPAFGLLQTASALLPGRGRRIA